MVDQDIPLQHKLPFVMIINEAFINSELETFVFNFANNKYVLYNYISTYTHFLIINFCLCFRSVWKNIELMTEMIENVNKLIKSIHDHESEAFERQKIKIRVLFSRHMTHMVRVGHYLALYGVTLDNIYFLYKHYNTVFLIQ